MVNNENSFILSNQETSNLPYLECLKFIVKASYCLIESGESHFIDFIHAQNLSFLTLEEEIADELISQFDFALGIPVARQILALSMLKNLFYESDDIIQKIKKNIIEKTKINLNKISDHPANALRTSRALLLFNKGENTKEEFSFFESRFNSFQAKISSQKLTKKEDLIAPLSYWEEESIRKVFYHILTQLECAVHSFAYTSNIKDNKISISLTSIKEEILNSSIKEIYNKSHFIIKLINLILKNNQNQQKIELVFSKEHENNVYINRLTLQLSKLNENILGIKNLQQKMLELNPTGIKFREMIDEEIQSLSISISKENISKARLEMRLNDDEYPLSVAFREHITKMLQHLED